MILGLMFYGILWLIFIGLPIIVSIWVTKAVAGRVRSVPGVVSKFRYSLPSLLAWCWPITLKAAVTVTSVPLIGRNFGLIACFLLPSAPPMMGVLMAVLDRRAAGG